jgi:hypothetical protein
MKKNLVTALAATAALGVLGVAFTKIYQYFAKD